MPYRWTTPPDAPVARLRLWPHQSLGPQGFAAVFAIFALLAATPFVAVIGSPVLWVMLAFVAPVFAALWLALRRNARDAGRHFEELELRADQLRLTHHPARGAEKTWRTNPYWLRIRLHDDGPVPDYLTLEGEGRMVELGRFLAPEERRALAAELREVIARQQAPRR